jgi:sugar lactone lactonase YvrE
MASSVGKIHLVLLLLLLPMASPATAEDETIPFDSERWQLEPGGRIVEHLGRQALAGAATLKDFDFENGVIEYDVAFTGTRTFAGVDFRKQSDDNYEHFYIRPHKSRFADALQYTPVFNGVSSWQLYSGDGFTSVAVIPYDEWLHVKIVISGTQGRVYLGGSEDPALVITDLKQGASKGALRIWSFPPFNAAFFSNFQVRNDDGIDLGKPRRTETAPGMIADWGLSQPIKISDSDRLVYPGRAALAGMEWKKAACDRTGLVDVSRFLKKTGAEPTFIYARTNIEAGQEKTMRLAFGYSDEISIFLNGKPLFYGNSSFNSRDPNFQGIVGLFDAAYLPLKKGNNELLLVLADVTGGWGFMCQDCEFVYTDPNLTELWDIPLKLKMPESAVYDAKRDVIYVSNYDPFSPRGQQYISKVSTGGRIISLQWVTGLANPTGLAIHGDKLYAVERLGVAEIDIETAEIVKHHMLPQPRFLNDIAIAGDGTIYVSDSAKQVIYSNAGGEFQEWLSSPELHNPNGLVVDGGRLIIGNSDGRLRAADLTTKEVTEIADLGPGLIDGLQLDGKGDYLASHYEGRIYRITPSGEVTKLLDRTAPGYTTADFAYEPGKMLLIVPSLQTYRLTAYELK